MEQIKYIGMHNLDDGDVNQIMKISEEQFTKIQVLVPNVSSLIVHIKMYSKAGSRKKYSVNVKAVAANNTFTSKHDDWRAEDVVRRALKKLEKELVHKFHKD